jgi:uncharacterized protein (DUF58 family)
LATPGVNELVDAGTLARLSNLTLLARLPMHGSVTGIHRSATRGASVEFAEYRKYVAGDNIRHLDWRVLARTDRYYMKEFEADTNLRCYLVLDASASMAFDYAGGRRFDFGRRLVATLAHLLLHQGDAVGLLCFTDRVVHDIPPRDTPSHLSAMFDILAALQPGGKTEIIKILHDLAEQVRQRALVIIVSDLFTEPAPLLECFEHMRFRKHDLAVFHLIDRQEFDFKFDRPIRFLDMESSFDLITDPDVIKTAYQRALDDYLQAVQTGAREFNVDYHRVFTDSNYEEVLAAFILQRLRKGTKQGR